MNIVWRRIGLVCAIAVLAGCTRPEGLIQKAKGFEDQKNWDAAEQAYQELIIKFPDSPFTSEAMYRIGLVYKDVRKDYSQSSAWFTQVVNKFSESEYAKYAAVGLIESPEYGGIIDGNTVVLGDAESGGKNLRIGHAYAKITFDTYKGTQSLFAGKSLVREEARFYVKAGNEVREFTADPRTDKTAKYTVILKYPYTAGNVWSSTRSGSALKFKIESDSLAIKLSGKEFKDCIKVSETNSALGGIKYFYYAPNLGCIKTAVSTTANPGRESITAELVQ